MTDLEKSRMMMERRENILQSQTAKITCNYIEYHKMTDQMFYGVPLTETHLAKCTERLKIYLANGGAGNIMIKLGIGIELTTKQTLLLPEEIVSERFVWLKGPRKGQLLERHEIEAIGMFLPGGALYQKENNYRWE